LPAAADIGCRVLPQVPRKDKKKMTFDLLFLPKGKSPFNGDAAYVFVSQWGGYGGNDRDPRYGYEMLTSESMSEIECHKQIDDLINDLKKLKIKASRKFRKQIEARSDCG